jgi:hypothetical protein
MTWVSGTTFTLMNKQTACLAQDQWHSNRKGESEIIRNFQPNQ